MHYYYSYKPNANTLFLYGSLYTDEHLNAAGLQRNAASLQPTNVFSMQLNNGDHDPLAADMSFEQWLEQINMFAEYSDFNPDYYSEWGSLPLSGLPVDCPIFPSGSAAVLPMEEDDLLSYDPNAKPNHGVFPRNIDGDLLPFMPTPGSIPLTQADPNISEYALPEFSADGGWLFGPLVHSNDPRQDWLEAFSAQPLTPATEVSEEDPPHPGLDGSRSKFCVTLPDAQLPRPQQQKQSYPQDLPSPPEAYPPGPYCTSCNLPFGRHADLRRHLETTKNHRKSTPAYRCTPCKRTFTRLDSLNRHLSSKKCRTGRAHDDHGAH
ncbi:hypothetical protein BCR43DRAFT_499739 [Syncephalastrum racemosum]|uniref:C2H2-type domain-containing protein n=1 Tax=Syncephalastrum racemosum TaxID=13706 RepID=A0A1X2GZH5_SYNRA|nr:hypothetical protein BCR43DRAFT_499739 [Syncephalastrum racemosum]